ncbi:MAG TPA: SDR family NAD(P)-dependent oxidoreductase [Limnochordia bacterium]
MTDLRGKVALITGSGRGLGRAYAEHLAKLGAAIAVHDVTETAPAEYDEAENLAAVAAAIREHGVRVCTVTGDLRRAETVDAIVAAVNEQLGPIDILVNNAGGDIAERGGKPKPNDAIGIPAEDVQAIIDRNLTATIHCCRAVAPQMMERRAGRIINISSVAGLSAVTDGVVYGAAKAGIIHYTRCLAKQLRPYGVTANCIAPGPTVTARFLATRYVSPEALKGGEGLDRLGRTEDLARVVEFLVSDLAAFVSGEVIAVDGGRK